MQLALIGDDGTVIDVREAGTGSPSPPSAERRRAATLSLH